MPNTPRDPAQDRDDLALLLSAAQAAGQIAMGFYRNNPRVWDKGGGQGPVTEADLAVNDLLHARLCAARPGYGWLSEESNPLGNLARLGHDTCFVIDPIDGTRSFIDGQPGFAHALAVVHRGRPVAAVVHLPALHLTYAACLGGGATLNGAAIAVATRGEADGASVLAARPALDPVHWPGGLPALDRQFRPSLAWRLALIGEGRYDAMLTVRDAWDWDIAGAALIAAEAGAIVTDRRGAPLRFNDADARSPGVLAAGPALHRALLAGLTGGQTAGGQAAGATGGQSATGAGGQVAVAGGQTAALAAGQAAGVTGSQTAAVAGGQTAAVTEGQAAGVTGSQSGATGAQAAATGGEAAGLAAAVTGSQTAAVAGGQAAGGVGGQAAARPTRPTTGDDAAGAAHAPVPTPVPPPPAQPPLSAHPDRPASPDPA